MKKTCFFILIALFLAEATYAEPVHKKFYYKKKTNLAYPATYSFRFSLWTTDTGGTEPVWSEDKDIHMTNNSRSTYLGDAISFESVPVEVVAAAADGPSPDGPSGGLYRRLVRSLDRRPVHRLPNGRSPDLVTRATCREHGATSSSGRVGW